MAKMILECEVEADTADRFDGIQVHIRISGEWQSVLLFGMPRAQRVREGKHLRVNNERGVVVKVGD